MWRYARVGFNALIAILGLSTIVYFFVPTHAHPRFFLRFPGFEQEIPHVFEENGHLSFGITTNRSAAVTITSVSVEPVAAEPMQFKAVDPFRTEATMAGVVLRWDGEENVIQGHFLTFSLPYEMVPPRTSPCSLLVAISVSGHLSIEDWGVPWSLFSLPTEKQTFVKRLAWKITPDVGEETGFQLRPHESARVFGQAAKAGIEIHGPSGFNVQTTEIFEDGSYQTKQHHGKVPASPAPESH
jgi:hypothetical protein